MYPGRRETRVDGLNGRKRHGVFLGLPKLQKVRSREDKTEVFPEPSDGTQWRWVEEVGGEGVDINTRKGNDPSHKELWIPMWTTNHP